MSRGKQIKTARFIFKELFGIEIQSNHEPSLKHKPTNNNFICHQMLDFKFLEDFQNMRIPLTCTFVDMDNIKLKQSEINRMELNNLVIICRNPPQSSRRSFPHNGTHVSPSKSVRLDHMPNCMDIEVPVVDDCADIVIILMMTILDSLLPVNVPFKIRSKDKIFLAAKEYLTKNNLRDICLPDIEDK